MPLYDRPLGAWGGVNEVVKTGLQGLALANQIENSQAERERLAKAEERAAAAESRAQTTFGQQQEEWNRLHAKSINVDDIVNRFPYLDDEGKKFVGDIIATYGGYKPGSMISKAEARELAETALKDPRVVAGLQNHMRRSLTEGIDKAQQDLQNLKSAEPASGLEGVARQAEIKKAEARLRDLTSTLDSMNYADQAWLAKKEQENKEKGFGLQERGVQVQERQAQTQADTAAAQQAHQKEQIGLEREKIGLERKKLEEAIKARLSEDQMKWIAAMSPKKKETVTDVAGNTIIMETPDLAKGYEAVRKMRPDMNLPELPKEKFSWTADQVSSLAANLRREPGKAAAVAQRMKELGTTAADLGGAEFAKHPDLVKIVAPYFRQEAPAGEAGTANAKPTRPDSAARAGGLPGTGLAGYGNPAPAPKPVVPGAGRSAFGINTGARIRDFLAGSTPEQRLEWLDAAVKAGTISPEAYKVARENIMEDIRTR
mgnify:CR=1 FL=1